jgi:hypothetical protein
MGLSFGADISIVDHSLLLDQFELDHPPPAVDRCDLAPLKPSFNAPVFILLGSYHFMSAVMRRS